ncbi:hypothetical protein QFZ36_000479 [Pseudarthrobacter siccitolerans]|uniref:Uncharacterized protein n=1 Tax=Pseudarthrobacter siccitolerans TaxID=861266 RepID=A0ABU0PG28_9MICC|nr:hypothetical protein [Pseudarthrobacter siccitolerans]MDQ0672918.1 hypothetical protein [Pseudarthrobacter siccitolerans]
MNSLLLSGTIAYSYSRGLSVVDTNWSNIRSDPELGWRIACAYLSAPNILTPEAAYSYEALCAEMWDQFEYLTSVIGIEVRVVDEDPYSRASELHADLDKGLLRVWATAAGNNSHPYFSHDANDVFRAVHDAFGHGSIGSSFGPNGEEAAWVKHSQMFSPAAQPAMTTETRGQTCTFLYGNDGKFFSEQKAILLPSEFWP